MLLFSIIGLEARADWVATVLVEVKTSRNGVAWDVLGGAPDLGICVVTASNTACTPTKYGVCQDRFDCRFSNVIIPAQAFTVWVFDMDLGEKDMAGAASCPDTKGSFGVKACVPDRETFVASMSVEIPVPAHD